MSEIKYVQRTQTVTLPNGAVKRIKAYGKTEKEAVMKLAQLVAKCKSGQMFPTSKTTFGAYAMIWMETYQKPCVAATTYDKNFRFLKNHILPYLEHIPFEHLTQTSIQQCMNHLQNDYAQDTIKKIYYLIYDIIEQARIDRIVQYNNAEGVVMPKGKPPKPRRALTEHERKIFLEVANVLPPERIARYLVSYFCGLRPAEARALQKYSWDKKNQEFIINNSMNPDDELIDPKSSAGHRRIPIPDRLQAILLKIPEPINPDYYLFGEGDKPCTKQRYERGWKRVKREMNIIAGAVVYRNQIVKPAIDDELTPYYLRHTYCTILAEEGVPIKTAQYLMGHSSIELTAKIYTHVTPKLYNASVPIIKCL